MVYQSNDNDIENKRSRSRERIKVRHVPIMVEGRDNAKYDEEVIKAQKNILNGTMGNLTETDGERRGRLQEAIEDFQGKLLRNKSRARRSSSAPGTQYLIKTETVGISNCPVHGEYGPVKANNRNQKNDKYQLLSGPLLAPSLIRSKSISLGRINKSLNGCSLPRGRPKHSTDLPSKPTSFANRTKRSDAKHFEQGQNQMVFNESKNKTEHDYISDVSHLSLFERLRKSNLPCSQKQNLLIKTCSDHKDLNCIDQRHDVSDNSRKSMLDITLKSHQKGILKSPGKSKHLSSHRVEFLDNLMEREIPGRYIETF